MAKFSVEGECSGQLKVLGEVTLLRCCFAVRRAFIWDVAAQVEYDLIEYAGCYRDTDARRGYYGLCRPVR